MVYYTLHPIAYILYIVYYILLGWARCQERTAEATPPHPSLEAFVHLQLKNRSALSKSSAAVEFMHLPARQRPFVLTACIRSQKTRRTLSAAVRILKAWAVDDRGTSSLASSVTALCTGTLLSRFKHWNGSGRRLSTHQRPTASYLHLALCTCQWYQHQATVQLPLKPAKALHVQRGWCDMSTPSGCCCWRVGCEAWTTATWILQQLLMPRL